MSDKSIDKLMEITGLDRHAADTILKINDNNLQQAINYHLETYGDSEVEGLPIDEFAEPTITNRRQHNNDTQHLTKDSSNGDADGRFNLNLPNIINQPGASSVSENASLPDFLSTDRTNSSSLDYNGGEDEVRAPIPSRREQLVLPEDDQFRFQSNGIRKRRATPATFTVCPFRNFAREAEQQEARLNNDADPANNTEPHFLASPELGNAFSRGSIATARAIRAKRKRLEDLFRPPSDILFWGTFQAARDHSTSLNRWLIVNVQDHREFKSQILNRDVWSNNELKEIITKYFVLWQISVDSIEGMRFKTFYRVENLPYVCLIDPRTGEDKKSFETSTAEILTSQLTRFLAENSFGLDSSCPPFNDLLGSDHNDLPSNGPNTSASISALATGYQKSNNATNTTTSTVTSFSNFRTAIQKFDNIKLNSDVGGTSSICKITTANPSTNLLSRNNSSDPFPPLLELSEQDQLNLAIQNSLKEKFSKDSKFDDGDDTNDTTNSNSDYNVDNSNDMLIGQEIMGLGMIRENNLAVCDDNATSYFEQIMKKVGKDQAKSTKHVAITYHGYLGDTKDPTTKIQIRLPLGERENLEWPSTTILRAIKLYINSKYPEFENENYKLISPYPRQNILDLDDQMTLLEANLHPTAILYLHQDD